MRRWPLSVPLAVVASVAVACLLIFAHMVHDTETFEPRLQTLVRSQASELTRRRSEVVHLRQVLANRQNIAPCANGVSAIVATSPTEPAARSATAGVLEADNAETYVLATRAEVASITAAADPVRVLRGLLGVARLLGRTLILPPSAASKNLLAGQHAETLAKLGVRVKPAESLKADLVPEALKCSHLRIELPRGLDSEQFAHAMRHYKTTRILEIDLPHVSYCGPSARADAGLLVAEKALDEIVRTVGGSGIGALLDQCLHSLKEEEVTQYWDIGKCSGHRVRVSLPEAIQRLPKGSDLMVTFSTGGVATMAHNWVVALRKAGVQTGVLVGALDAQMHTECERRGLPCVPVHGDNETTAQLKQCKEQNIRACPQQYPKMSVLKVGFYRELLALGFNVFACDADAIFMGDPRPLMREEPWVHADVAIATDCIDLPGDARRPLLHCDFNTGLVFMRGSSQSVLDFTEQWREKVANAKEMRIRDQAAFNMITKAAPGMVPYLRNGTAVPRVYLAARGPGGTPLRLGALPLNRFLNGHTFFVQHVHTLPNAHPAISVHMTYQFAEGSTFAYGKRQRLREAGLWFVDGDDYYSGKYLSVSAAGATLPPITIATNADSRDAIKQHLAERDHLVRSLRALLGVAKALGRQLVLPRMLCYCDYMWKEMRSCRVGGAESMRLPYDCPMDHVLDTPRFFENDLGVQVREPTFLSHPRLPRNVSRSVSKVVLPAAPLDDVGVRQLLAPYESAGVIELDEAVGRFCGFRDASTQRAFLIETERMLTYERVPFCTTEGSNDAPLYSRCCTPWHEGEKFFPCVYGFGEGARPGVPGKVPPLPECGSI